MKIQTIECKVESSNDAHALGQELENRLAIVISNLIPNLRQAPQVQEGVVNFSMQIIGHRMRIQQAEQDRLQIEDVERQKK